MTTTKGRPIPPHGTGNRYKGTPSRPGCRCQPCTRAAVREDQERILDRLRGNPRMVPADETIAHLGTLRAAGLSWSQIARAAGTAASTPREIYVERFTTVSRTNAQKLLAVKPHNRPAVGFVNALGARRRLQALYALGHGHLFLVNNIGISSSCISDILSGRNATIEVDIDTRVRATFKRLSMTIGANARTRARARREGWPPPLAWDDIDNPNETPDLGQPVRRNTAVIEDTAELAAQGVPREDIAHRIGISWHSIERAHWRAGVPIPHTVEAAA